MNEKLALAQVVATVVFGLLTYLVGRTMGRLSEIDERRNYIRNVRARKLPIHTLGHLTTPGSEIIYPLNYVTGYKQKEKKGKKK